MDDLWAQLRGTASDGVMATAAPDTAEPVRVKEDVLPNKVLAQLCRDARKMALDRSSTDLRDRIRTLAGMVGLLAMNELMRREDAEAQAMAKSGEFNWFLEKMPQ